MENNVDKQYIAILKDIKENGILKETRSGKVLSVFGRTMRFNLEEGFPLLTTKKVFYRGIIEELLWFLKGKPNIKYLVEKNVNIWNQDAFRYYKEVVDRHSNGKEVKSCGDIDTFLNYVRNGSIIHFKDGFTYEYGDLGNMYPTIWRHFGSNNIDQIQYVIDEIKNNPNSRRIVLTCYDPNSVSEAALYPCHILYEFNVTEDEEGSKKLNCLLNVRSNDWILGNPYNIASAAFLTHMIAQVTNIGVGDLLYVGCDCHLYCNQSQAYEEQLKRDPNKYSSPKLELNTDVKNIDDFKYEDFKIVGYESYPSIKAPLSVG